MKSLILSLAMAFLALPKAWAEASAEPPKAELGRGKVLFTRLCAQCHGAEAQGVKSLGAPNLSILPAWYMETQVKKFQGGLRGGHPKDTAGLRMRPMGLVLKTEEELQMVSAYIANLPKVMAPQTLSGSPVKGETKYTICATCHGADGKGNQALAAPPLVGQNDWYIHQQLSNFRKAYRGFDAAQDPLGAAMRGMAATLDDKGDADVTAYLYMIAK